MEGYLNKTTPSTYFSRWKRRYFTLRDNIIYHFKEKGGELRGRYHLSVTQVKEYDKPDKCFELFTGSTSILFRAETLKERDAWVNKIKSTQFEHEQYEKEYLKRNTEIFKSPNGVYDEIVNLQSKLDVIKKYTTILDKFNDKIYELVKQRNCIEEIKSITKESKVRNIGFLII